MARKCTPKKLFIKGCDYSTWSKMKKKKLMKKKRLIKKN